MYSLARKFNINRSHFPTEVAFFVPYYYNDFVTQQPNLYNEN
ncbi:hypothetical protein I597_2235 [Dokdonia donghaensis DSW-1]|nr:hypothetical protein I597_2235 [Dokdonia donghaensis DSW-1]